MMDCGEGTGRERAACGHARTVEHNNIIIARGQLGVGSEGETCQKRGGRGSRLLVFQSECGWGGGHFQDQGARGRGRGRARGAYSGRGAGAGAGAGAAAGAAAGPGAGGKGRRRARARARARTRGGGTGTAGSGEHRARWPAVAPAGSGGVPLHVCVM